MAQKSNAEAEPPTRPNRKKPGPKPHAPFPIEQGRPLEYDEARPWVRQPCDTNTRWAAFLTYREQSPPRSLSRLARESGRDRSRLQEWSSAYSWPERSAAYDRHLDAARVSAVVDALSEDARAVASRHAAVLRDAQIAAASVVKSWLNKLANGESLDGWTPNDVRGMLRDLIQLERLVRGEATARVEVGVGFDLTRLSVEEIETMRALEAKAGA